jgi:hypothetical protein
VPGTGFKAISTMIVMRAPPATRLVAISPKPRQRAVHDTVPPAPDVSVRPITPCRPHDTWRTQTCEDPTSIPTAVPHRKPAALRASTQIAYKTTASDEPTMRAVRPPRLAANVRVRANAQATGDHCGGLRGRCCPAGLLWHSANAPGPGRRRFTPSSFAPFVMEARHVRSAFARAASGQARPGALQPPQSTRTDQPGPKEELATDQGGPPRTRLKRGPITLPKHRTVFGHNSHLVPSTRVEVN